jgi:hypothetical protein
MKAKNHVSPLSTRDEAHLLAVIYAPQTPVHERLTHPYLVTTKDGANYAWCDSARQAALVFATDENAHYLHAIHLDYLRLMPRGDIKTPWQKSADEIQKTWRDVADATMHDKRATQALIQWRADRKAAGLERK